MLFVIGAVLLAAPPPFTSFQGKSLLDDASNEAGYGWLLALFAVVSACTAGAVLRVAGRVFLGWGPSEGPDPEQARAAEERVDEERDERDHTPIVMIAVPAVLLSAAAVVGLIPGFVPSVQDAAVRFTDHAAYVQWVVHGAAHTPWPHADSSHVPIADVLTSLAGVLGAVGAAALGLFGRPLREALPERVRAPARRALVTLRMLHSGHIGDYIAWWTAGASVLGGVCLVALR